MDLLGAVSSLDGNKEDLISINPDEIHQGFLMVNVLYVIISETKSFELRAIWISTVVMFQQPLFQWIPNKFISIFSHKQVGMSKIDEA